jgi:DNA (cytosine-5)-methyltransferase 1
MYKLIDLCTGIGTFSLACPNSECVFANDICKYSKIIFDLHHQVKLKLGNLNNIQNSDIPNCDIITFGNPCQSWSLAGLKGGFNDPRTEVFWKIVSIIHDKQPKVFVMENVKNLTTHNGKKDFESVLNAFAPYHLKYKVLNTAEITGIPHHRERIFVVGFKDKQLADQFNLDFDKVPKLSIRSVLDMDVDDKYYYTPTSTIYPKLAEVVLSNDVVYQYRRTIVRANKSGEFPTLTANMGTGGHNVPIIKDHKGIRKITPREAFRLQGFEDQYELPIIADSHLYKLVGNAVTKNIVCMILTRIVNLLNQQVLVQDNLQVVPIVPLQVADQGDFQVVVQDDLQVVPIVPLQVAVQGDLQVAQDTVQGDFQVVQDEQQQLLQVAVQQLHI